MKVLSLSLDSLILQKESVVASRCIRYGSIVDRYTIIVPSTQCDIVTHSATCTAYGSGGLNKLFQLFRLWHLASVLIKKDHYGVISSQDTYFLGCIAWLLARRHHLGLEVQVLGIEKLSFFRKLLSKFVLARASSIRVLSLGLKKRLIAEFGISDAQMMLVPIYVDVSSLGFNREDLSAEDAHSLSINTKLFEENYGGRFNILSVNRLVPIKNISMQLQAVAKLRTEFPQLLLHIVGDGPLRGVLEKEITTLGIEKHVVLHGFKSGVQLSPFFTQSDCFVLTSDFEGYGMVVIESATAGLPIVMTDVGCAGEVIINEKSGIIVPPKDTVAFTDALRLLMIDKNFREKLKAGALQSIAELPSFDTVLQKYKASWQRALEKRY